MKTPFTLKTRDLRSKCRSTAERKAAGNCCAEKMYGSAPRVAPLIFATILLPGIGFLSACQTPTQRVSQKEDNLAAAGFVIRPANTPERRAMLAKLPPDRFVVRAKGNDVHYVYADPLVCGCLYVGSQAAYSQYKRHEQEQHLADEQQMTAQTYSDAAWNWSAWGPWGPEYEFGYGFGW